MGEFWCIEFDLTIKREERLTNYLKNLVDQNKMDVQTYNQIRPVGSKPGDMYGLTKIYKKDTSIRPIISSVNTYNYNLPKYLDEIIKNSIKNNDFVIKDTFDYVNKISKIKYFNGYMISFDIESLFTNIPLEETIQIVMSKLFKDKDSRIEGLKKFQFERLLRTATQESHFYFKGNYFNQIDGVAMGSPLAPTLANIFISEIENKIMNELRNKGVLSWMRYVDDTFVIVENKDKIEDILTFLNSQHKNIKFTVEFEDKHVISFLDVRVKRKNESFITDVYRKKTFSGT